MKDLDSTRVVEVLGSREANLFQRSTGYCLTKRTILTCSHGLAMSGKVEVRLLAIPELRDRWLPARIVWDGSRLEDPFDAALLALEDADAASVAGDEWPDPLTLRALGERERWSSRGILKAVDRTTKDGSVYSNVESFGGVLYPEDSPHALISLEISSPPSDPSGWAGASGSPVFTRGGLSGVVVSWPRAYDGRRLKAVPVRRLWDLPGFATASGIKGVTEIEPTNRDLIDFSAELKRHADLCGRERVLGFMDPLLLREECEWVVVSGPPGVGKTAILSHYVRRFGQDQPGSGNGSIGRAYRVPHHFVRRSVHDWDQPHSIVKNLSAQLSLLFPSQTALDVREPERFAEQLRLVSERVLSKTRSKLILIVDGLDQLRLHRRENLSAVFPERLPPHVTFLVSLRHEPQLLRWFKEERTQIIDLGNGSLWGKSNEQAVREFWAKHQDDFEARIHESQIERLTAAAKGLILHAVTQLEDMRQNPGGVGNLPSSPIPMGLSALWREQWERLVHEDREGEGCRALRLLCNARGAMSYHEIREQGRFSVPQMDRILALIGQFLIDTPDGYLVYHDGFREFVEDRLHARRRMPRTQVLTFAALAVVGIALAALASTRMGSEVLATVARWMAPRHDPVADEAASVIGGLPRLIGLDVNGRVVGWTILPEDGRTFWGGVPDEHYRQLVPPEPDRNATLHRERFGPPNGTYFVFHNYGRKAVHNLTATVVAPCELGIAEERGGAKVESGTDVSKRGDRPPDVYSLGGCGDYEHRIAIELLPSGAEVVFASGGHCHIAGENCYSVYVRAAKPGRAKILFSKDAPASLETTAFDLMEELVRASQSQIGLHQMVPYLSETRSWIVQASLGAVMQYAKAGVAGEALCEVVERPLTEARVRWVLMRSLLAAEYPGWTRCAERAAGHAPVILSAIRPNMAEEFIPSYLRLLRDGREGKDKKHLSKLIEFGVKQYASSARCGMVYGPIADENLAARLAADTESNGIAFLVAGLACSEVQDDKKRAALLEDALCGQMRSVSEERRDWSPLSTLRAAYGADKFEEYLWTCFVQANGDGRPLNQAAEPANIYFAKNVLGSLPEGLSHARWRNTASVLLKAGLASEDREKTKLAIALAGKLAIENRHALVRDAKWRSAAWRLFDAGSAEGKNDDLVELAINLAETLDAKDRGVLLRRSWRAEWAKKGELFSKYLSALQTSGATLPKPAFLRALKDVGPANPNTHYALFRVAPRDELKPVELYELWRGGEEHASAPILEMAKAVATVRTETAGRLRADLLANRLQAARIRDGLSLLSQLSSDVWCEVLSKMLARERDADAKALLLDSSQGRPCTLPQILPAVEDPSPKVRIAATRAIESARQRDGTTKQRRKEIETVDDKLVATLERLAMESDKNVKQTAIRALCTTPYVSDFIDVFERLVRSNEVLALECMLEWYYWRSDGTGLSLRLWDEAVPKVLRSGLARTDGDACVRTAQWAGKNCAKEVVDMLREVTSRTGGDCPKAARIALQSLESCRRDQ